VSFDPAPGTIAAVFVALARGTTAWPPSRTRRNASKAAARGKKLIEDDELERCVRDLAPAVVDRQRMPPFRRYG
jgi:hypothetical protein